MVPADLLEPSRHRAIVEDVERASLRAWPAPHEQRIGGWLLRMAGGYTKRANSATLLDGGAPDLDQDIARCEAYYRAAGLPPIFRLPSYTVGAADDLLVARGYRLVEPVLVLGLALAAAPTDGIAPADSLELDEWLDIYSRLQGSTADGRTAHRRILETISLPALYAVTTERDAPVACALGVLDGSHFGLFDVVTDPARRNRGFGRRLIAGMLGWARTRGATLAYLQVSEHNAPALRLYDKLGFTQLYRYWYRVAPT